MYSKLPSSRFSIQPQDVRSSIHQIYSNLQNYSGFTNQRKYLTKKMITIIQRLVCSIKILKSMEWGGGSRDLEGRGLPLV